MKKSIWLGMAAGAVVLIVVVVLAAIFLIPVQRVLAGSFYGNGPLGGPPWAHAWRGGPGGYPGFQLPEELQGLASIPADQRFSHFEGVQVHLKDQNNQPLTVNVIPGKVTESSATSLTITTNSGETQSFTLNDQTIIHTAASTSEATGTPPASTGLANGEEVVVVTMNDNSTATAVITGGPDGFGSAGHGGWWKSGR